MEGQLKAENSDDDAFNLYIEYDEREEYVIDSIEVVSNGFKQEECPKQENVLNDSYEINLGGGNCFESEVEPFINESEDDAFNLYTECDEREEYVIDSIEVFSNGFKQEECPKQEDVLNDSYEIILGGGNCFESEVEPFINESPIASTKTMGEKKSISTKLSRKRLPFKNKSNNLVQAVKAMRPPCGAECRLSCSTKIPHEKRLEINEYFWSLNSLEQKVFYGNFVKKIGIKRRSVINDENNFRKKNAFQYSLKPGDTILRVCKKFFLSTLGISDRAILYFFSKRFEKDTLISIKKCMKCYPLPVEVKGYGSCTHLKRRHGDAMAEQYRAHMKSKKRRTNPNVQPPSSSTSSRKIYEPEQIMQEFSNVNFAHLNAQMPNMPKVMKTSTDRPLIAPIVPTLKYTPAHFIENAANFFISTLIPTKIIENPYFKKLFLELNLPEQALQTITCQNLEQRIKQRYQEHVARTLNVLSKLEYYAVTVHMWNSEKCTFVGLVVHWLEQDLRRNSLALAIRQIEHENPNDQSIEAVLTEFSVFAGKIQATLIGNGKNYINEYVALGVHLTNIVREQALEMENSVFCATWDIPIEQSILTQNTLPSQLICPSHLLNEALSVAFKEIFQVTNETVISKMHAAVMTHCNILWKAVCKPESANFSIKLKYPTFDNWRSLIDAFEQIAALSDKSQHLYDALRPAEISYLLEFLNCTAPIMEALSILQTQENAYFGIVLPCLFALKRNLQKVGKTNNLSYCQPLLDAYLKTISNYFSEYLQLRSQNARNAAIAALSYPRFKNQWFVCVEPEQRVDILNFFKMAISEHIVVKPSIKHESSSGHEDVSRSFFDFGDENLEDIGANKNLKTKSQISLDNMVEAQVLQFFAEESTEITILNQYPEIKKVFMQYNTPLPSLAIGENLFPSATMNNLKRNHKEFNPLMEKRLVLNAHLDKNQY